MIGKTGTLTTGDLKVSKFYVQSKVIENSRVDTLYNSKLNNTVIDLIEDSILYNTDARVEINQDSKFEPVGNPTEVAFLRFLQDANLPVHHLIKRKMGRVMHHQPFSSSTKNSVIAIKYQPGKFGEEGDDDCVRVFIKGAPEDIITACDYNFNGDGEIKDFCLEDRNMVINDIVKDVFSKQSLRSIALAYRDYTHSAWEQYKMDICND